jgi:hypothetical protein
MNRNGAAGVKLSQVPRQLFIAANVCANMTSDWDITFVPVEITVHHEASSGYPRA